MARTIGETWWPEIQIEKRIRRKCRSIPTPGPLNTDPKSNLYRSQKSEKATPEGSCREEVLIQIACLKCQTGVPRFGGHAWAT